MQSSNNFFQLAADLQKNIDWLNHILKGSETDDIIVDGVIKPSISKDIKAHYSGIQAMVQGRAAYELKIQLPAKPPVGIVLAEVWRDPVADNNGLYGWTGTGWEKSPYDVKETVNLVAGRFDELSLQDDEKPLADTQGNEYAYAVTDENGQTLFAFSQLGELLLGLMGLMSDSDAHGFQFAIADGDGRVAMGVGADGEVLFGQSSVESVDDERFAWALVDALGRMAAQVEKDGAFTTNGITIESEGELSSHVFAITDESGRAVLMIGQDGKVWFSTEEDKPPVRPIDALTKMGSIPADDMQFFCYGQSLSRGQNALPCVSVTQPFNNVTFASGVCSWSGDGFDLSSFRPLTETPYQGPGENNGETPTSSALNEASRRLGTLYSDNGFRFIGSAPGRGGYRINRLNKGTERYQSLIDQVAAAYAISQSEGRTHNVQAVFWTQGEADYVAQTGREGYKNLLVGLRDDISLDSAAITGQSFRVPLITYQVTSHKYYGFDYPSIALAQWDAANQDPDIILATPIYHMDYADMVHLENHDSEWLGRYYGKAYAEAVYHKRPWKPLQPEAVTLQGKIIEVLFHVPTPPLVFDTDWVTAAVNMGFDIYDAEHQLLDIIDQVVVSGPSRVRITLTQSPPVGATLTYAHGRESDGPKSGRQTGARGNLRDSEGNNDIFTDASGQVRRMDNWCVIFDTILGES
ncbi:TPA: sialate O-acetylesterase [Vibrio cholerae]